MITGSGRSRCDSNGNPLQYFSLGSPIDREGWWAIVNGIARVRQNLVTKPPPPRSTVSTQYFEGINKEHFYQSVSSVAQLCPTLCDPMNCRMPGFPIHHQLLKLTQTHVYQVGNAIQPSDTLLVPSPLTFNLSQHQSLFQ